MRLAEVSKIKQASRYYITMDQGAGVRSATHIHHCLMSALRKTYHGLTPTCIQDQGHRLQHTSKYSESFTMHRPIPPRLAGVYIPVPPHWSMRGSAQTTGLKKHVRKHASDDVLILEQYARLYSSSLMDSLHNSTLCRRDIILQNYAKNDITLRAPHSFDVLGHHL